MDAATQWRQERGYGRRRHLLSPRECGSSRVGTPAPNARNAGSHRWRAAAQSARKIRLAVRGGGHPTGPTAHEPMGASATELAHLEAPSARLAGRQGASRGADGVADPRKAKRRSTPLRAASTGAERIGKNSEILCGPKTARTVRRIRTDRRLRRASSGRRASSVRERPAGPPQLHIRRLQGPLGALLQVEARVGQGLPHTHRTRPTAARAAVVARMVPIIQSRPTMAVPGHS